jgi:hypothetical protein
MLSQLTVTVNGTQVVVPSSATVAVAMTLAWQACRTSVSGELRAPLCGVGIASRVVWPSTEDHTAGVARFCLNRAWT